ncbi:MAG: hypothetical protein CMF55_03835 [Legionellales bacterium]|nr:hypothetical protein [Legionellales bacterium]|tara:strand:- start:17405 stop:18721 length:1317 start_codon:yes stop_codon:yes gene_type:complete
MKSTFSDVASKYELYTKGTKKPLLSYLKQANNSDVDSIIRLFFGEDCVKWSYGKMVGHVASDTGVFTEVVRDIVGNTKESLIECLVSESEDGSGWSLAEAAWAMKSFTNPDFGQDVSWKDCARAMNQIEAKLFWRTALGARRGMSKHTFLKTVKRNGVTDEMIVSANLLNDNMNLREAFYTMVMNPSNFSDENYVLYTNRRLLPWNENVNLIEYNGGLCQVIEGKGNRILHRTDDYVIEYTKGGIAYDAFFFEETKLRLQERLAKLEDMLNEDEELPFEEVAYLREIPPWNKIEEFCSDNTIRFPNLKSYTPDDYGGYLMVLKEHVQTVRLSWYEVMGGAVKVGFDVMDGTDLMPAGELIITELNKVSLFHRVMKKWNIKEFSLDEMRNEIPNELCIIVEIVSPSLDASSMQFKHPVFHQFNENKGISDMTQIVDVIN